MDAGRTVAPVVVVVDVLYDYHRRLVEGLGAALAAHGTSLVVHVCNVYDDGAPRALLRQLAAGRYSGVVVMALNSPRAQAELLAALAGRSDVPAVGVGVRVPGRPAVTPDNRTGMRELMRHLLDHRGVRRVALVRGVPHHPDSREREEVVRAELARRGLALDADLVVEGAFDRDPTYRALRQLHDRRPLESVEAVVALNDVSAFGVLDVLDEVGVRVPGGVLVSGFDDHPAARHPDVGLTTVDQGLREQGAAAADLLRRRAGEPSGDVVVPSRLVVRSSTGGGGPAPASAALGPRSRGGLGGAAVDDTALAMVRGFADARSHEQVMGELAACLPRLGVSRAFVVLHQPADDAADAAPAGRLVLRFPPAGADARDEEVFDTDALLPPHLEPELATGTHVRHVLEVRGAELGYVLTEQAELNGRSAELMRLELSRTLDGIARTRELADRAAQLEHLVEERTRQLRHEVQVRRRAESQLRARNDELRASLHLDGLTGIANRRAFDDSLTRMWDDAAGSGRPLSLLLVDVDFFKAYNDSYGHLRGDEALRVVARSLPPACLGPDDLCARYGGEEFAVLLPGTVLRDAVEVAERVRSVLAQRRLPHRASSVGEHLTVSVGVASQVPDRADGPLDLLRRADAQLYRAKHEGRDRVRSSAEVPAVARPT